MDKLNRFNELKAKGWRNLDKDERKEYSTLKVEIGDVETVVAPPIEPPQETAQETATESPAMVSSSSISQAIADASYEQTVSPEHSPPIDLPKAHTLTLEHVCADLFRKIPEGSLRATIIAYRDLKNDKSVVDNLKQLMQDFGNCDGGYKGHVNNYIKILENENNPKPIL